MALRLEVMTSKSDLTEFPFSHSISLLPPFRTNMASWTQKRIVTFVVILQANPALAAAKKEKNDACREKRAAAGSSKTFS